ncbi:hypothetical protein JCM3765_001222 [Sporobolomyces pararoseus]
MSTELLKDTQIDRLSSLPPELLSYIFDLAHSPEHPLIHPISRTLLPYCRQTLYRKIDISSLSLSKLLTAVETTHSLAPLVQDLRIHYVGDAPLTDFESIANLFPALKSLDYHGKAQLSKLDPIKLAPLQSLSYTPLVFDTDEIEALSCLPLVKLELKLYDSEIKLSDNFQPSTTIRTLEELTLVEAYSSLDDDEWDVRIGRFVESCPKLRSLKLVDGVYPRFGKFLKALVGGVPLLTKLYLDTSILPESSFCSFTDLYPLFPNLTYLSLGDGTTAPDLVSHLHQLSFLTTLRLEPHAHFGFESAENLFSLVQASTKPPVLKLFILDCFAAKIGHRCDIQDELPREQISYSYFKATWRLPSFSDVIEGEECRQLLELAKANNVRVEGDIYAAVAYSNSWKLEVTNRHVLYACQNQTLELLQSFGESDQAERLPNLDLDELDLDNLKLV